MSVKKKILIVEDEPEIAELFSLQLRTSGFDVFHSDQEPEIIRIIREEKPDLMLLDLVMPDADGYHILTHIKEEKIKGKTKIFVWSNLTQDSEMSKAKELGADGYLVKSDYTPTKLGEKVKEILKK